MRFSRMRVFIASSLCAAITLAGGGLRAADFQVSNTSDGGAGSLRQALFDAESNTGEDRIVFDPELSGTILSGTPLSAITESLVVEGPGAKKLTIDFNGTAPGFHINPTGGGVAVAISGLTLSNAQGHAIWADESEGGFFLEALDVRSAVITENQGAGIHAVAREIEIVDCDISHNTSGLGGAAGIQSDAETLFVSKTTIALNHSTLEFADAGAGLSLFNRHFSNSSAEIVNSTIDNNRAATEGAGVYISTGNPEDRLTVHLGSLTVTNNVSDGFVAWAESVGFSRIGAGITQGFSTGAETIIELKDSIVAGNTDTLGGGLYGLTDCAAKIASLGNNLISLINRETGSRDFRCDFSGADGVNGDQIGSVTIAEEGAQPEFNWIFPLLAPLADNGGPTQTRALLPGSPAADAGSDNCPETDQRGLPRLPGPCDVGAFERQPPVLTLSTDALVFSAAVEQDSENQEIVLTSAGQDDYPLSISEVSNGNPAFRIDNRCGTSLPRGNSCKLLVTFHPEDYFIQEDTILVHTSDVDSPASIHLEGRGTDLTGSTQDAQAAGCSLTASIQIR